MSAPCIASTFVEAPAIQKIKGVTASAKNPAGSVVVITLVPTLAPPPVLLVWKHVHGGAPITSVRLLVVRYVASVADPRFVVAKVYL